MSDEAETAGAPILKRVSIFEFPVYNINMVEHIEDLRQHYAELKKRLELVRSYL
jgi:hypothetical protein